LSETIFNLGRWVRRLGWQRSSEPELGYHVQPVQIVSNVRSLTPEVRGPSALYGGLCVANIVNFATYEFASRAEGGCLVGSFGLSMGLPATDITLRISTSPIAFTTSTAVIPQVMEPGLVSTALAGMSLTSILAVGAPRIPGGAVNIPAFWPADSLYIPSGSFLVLQGNTLDSDLRVAHTVQELPALRGD